MEDCTNSNDDFDFDDFDFSKFPSDYGCICDTMMSAYRRYLETLHQPIEVDKDFNFESFMNKYFDDLTDMDSFLLSKCNECIGLIEADHQRYLDAKKRYESIKDGTSDTESVFDMLYNAYLEYVVEKRETKQGSIRWNNRILSQDEHREVFHDPDKYRFLAREPKEYISTYTDYLKQLRTDIISHILDRENFNIYCNMNPKILDIFYELGSSRGYVVFVDFKPKKLRSRKHLDMIMQSGSALFIRTKSEMRHENQKHHKPKKLSRRERKRLNLLKIKEEA